MGKGTAKPFLALCWDHLGSILEPTSVLKSINKNSSEIRAKKILLAPWWIHWGVQKGSRIGNKSILGPPWDPLALPGAILDPSHGTILNNSVNILDHFLKTMLGTNRDHLRSKM